MHNSHNIIELNNNLNLQLSIKPSENIHHQFSMTIKFKTPSKQTSDNFPHTKTACPKPPLLQKTADFSPLKSQHKRIPELSRHKPSKPSGPIVSWCLPGPR